MSATVSLQQLTDELADLESESLLAIDAAVTEANQGMQTLERALATLAQEGRISKAEALAKSSRSDELERLFQLGNGMAVR